MYKYMHLRALHKYRLQTIFEANTKYKISFMCILCDILIQKDPQNDRIYTIFYLSIKDFIYILSIYFSINKLFSKSKFH